MHQGLHSASIGQHASLPTVAIYSPVFLRPSMTFIYRQARAVTHAVRPIVFTSRIENADSYPFSPVFDKRAQAGWSARIMSKLYRILARKFTYTTKQQLKYWKSICRNQNVQLIHAHFGYGGLQMLPIAHDLEIPLLTTFHGIDASKLLEHRVYVANLKKLFAYAHIIAVSQKMALELKGLGAVPERLYMHYIGAPTEDFKRHDSLALKSKASKGDEIVFLQVSNFVEKKGHRYTVEAFHRFLAFYPNSRLVLAGDGPTRESVTSLCRSLGIDDKVKFVGKVCKTEVINLMSTSDVFLHHSVTTKDNDQEGLPTVLMEAMAMSLPVISTFHSAIPELVRNGVDGYLVPERNIEEYVERMKDILGFVPGNTREWITTHFDLGKNSTRLADIYHQIMHYDGDAII